MTELRIGTRGSALALAQAQSVADALAAKSGITTRLVTVTTDGDRSSAPLASMGGAGVFAGALREALTSGRCDVVVHSLKDLPTASDPVLSIAAVPRREDARDALCTRSGETLSALPEGARIGTGSPRRAAQLRAHRPDIEVVTIRGNVDTRLAALERTELDGVVLAAAGLNRLGRTGVVTELFDLNDWPTAPGQGALAVEVRRGDEHLARRLDHAGSRTTAEAERRVLTVLEAGCSAPVGAHAFVDAGLLFLSATVYSADGARSLTESRAAPPTDSRELADSVAEELLARGAAELTGATP